MIRFFSCLFVVVLAGCSNFDARFAKAVNAPVPHMQASHPAALAGAYSGRWASARNSAWGGDLRCIVTPVAGESHSGDVAYQAEFHATWHGMSYTHKVVLHTKLVGGKKSVGVAREFEGASTLHTIIGAGTYMCKGTMDGTVMRACYDATYDKGTMDLRRAYPQPASSARQ